MGGEPPVSGIYAGSSADPFGGRYSQRGLVFGRDAEENSFGRPRHVSGVAMAIGIATDRKSTRLNSSHVAISYAVFCLKKKKRKPDKIKHVFYQSMYLLK